MSDVIFDYKISMEKSNSRSHIDEETAIYWNLSWTNDSTATKRLKEMGNTEKKLEDMKNKREANTGNKQNSRKEQREQSAGSVQRKSNGWFSNSDEYSGQTVTTGLLLWDTLRAKRPDCKPRENIHLEGNGSYILCRPQLKPEAEDKAVVTSKHWKKITRK